MNTQKTESGFSLIEVLVALLVLAIGLLGMATLLMTSLQSNQSAYLRSQASLLAYDIVERMRGNSDHAITTNDYTLSSTSAASSSPSCAATGCTPSAQAKMDLHDWREALSDSIPGATATITHPNPVTSPKTSNNYTIKISWQESSALEQKTADSNIELKVNL